MVIAGAVFCSKAAEFKSVLLQILSISCQKLCTANKQNKQEILESCVQFLACNVTAADVGG